ncbi:flagellar brake protein [Oceanobacillus saliphilus]|uniref:flagellar brake protein n=1 Tax=Oceanobacillus saliphilus TaxID=2925834 RepID=UPI00201E5AC8|nr:flagellar brake domain-containing protein [Oceanobacillus saliphilus]
MKIGTVLNLEVKDIETGETHEYHCKIIEKNDKFLIIDYPIHVKTKKTAFFSKGTYITATFMGKDQAVYKFSSQIAARIKLNIPALAITIPDNKNMKRIQRREYVRIETSLDIAVHSVDNQFHPFATVTFDISGGGLAVIVPTSTQLEIGQKTDIWLPLPMQNQEYHYVYGQTEIVLIRELNTRMNMVSLKFISISNSDRQKIVRFCFEKQREARQKELI